MEWRMIRFLMWKTNGHSPTLPYRVAEIGDIDAPPLTDALRPAPQGRPPPWELGVTGARLILNGFPKAGLHLAERFVLPLMRAFLVENWIGVVEQHGWSTRIKPDISRTLELVRWLDSGTFVKGHLPYHSDLAAEMERGHIGMVLVIRDLRDVACSIKRHLEKPPRAHWVHPGRDEFMTLPEGEARLLAVINGFGEYPGMMERWRGYARWLERPYVLPLQYEFMMECPRWAYELIARFIVGLGFPVNGLTVQMVRADVDRHWVLVERFLADPSRSATYVQGRVGAWREEFTPSVRQAFDDTGGSEWLVRLGYEQTAEWE